MKIKISTETFRVISVFERITKVHPKDCLITEDIIYFIVEPNFMRLVIGKGGVTIKEVGKHLAKPIKVFEYSDDPETFIKNMIPSAESIEVKENLIEVTVPPEEKSATIGKGGKNIKAIREIVNRHLKIENVRLK